jgi:hypothetical protein
VNALSNLFTMIGQRKCQTNPLLPVRQHHLRFSSLHGSLEHFHKCSNNHPAGSVMSLPWMSPAGSFTAMPDIFLTMLNSEHNHAAFGLHRVNGCHSVAGIFFDRGDTLPHR